MGLALDSAIIRLRRPSTGCPGSRVEERKLVWLRAARVRVEAITWEFGCDDHSWRRWTD